MGRILDVGHFLSSHARCRTYHAPSSLQQVGIIPESQDGDEERKQLSFSLSNGLRTRLLLSREKGTTAPNQMGNWSPISLTNTCSADGKSIKCCWGQTCWGQTQYISLSGRSDAESSHLYPCLVFHDPGLHYW